MPTADHPSSGAATAPNPFAAQAVQESDGGADLVDITGLHDGARQTLLRARFRVRAGRPYLAVVVGDEGAGKSHLLWWLRRQSAASHGLFISMGALPDVAQPFRHALKQLVSALCRKDGDGRGPFERIIDRLLWEALYAQACDLLDGARIGMYQAPAALLKLLGPLCQEAGRRRELGDFATQAQPIWSQVEPGLRAYLLSLPTEMSIDSAARAVLLQYPYADRRALCTAWLAGEELSAKDRERISAKQSINNESAAKYVLCALCRLLTGSAGAGSGPGVPLTLTYDQTDAVARELGLPGVQGMAEVVSAIQAQGGATLQVLSCRPDTFRMLVHNGARPGPGQLKSVDETLQLSRPAVAQLRELVAARAGQSSALSPGDLDPTSWPQEVATPRAALAYLAGLWSSRTGALAIPVSANDAPTAKGLPTGPLKAPAAAKSAPLKAVAPQLTGKTSLSKPNVAAVNAKAAQSRPISPKNAPSQPGSAVAVPKKNAPSTPPVSAPPPREEPSAASPSITWMAMASDEDVAPVSLDGGKKSTSPKATKKPEKKDEPAKVALKSVPQLPENPVSIGPSPPSAQSPSVTWMAMAEDDDPLARALAAVDAEDAAAAAGSAPAGKARTTKERLRAIGNSSSRNPLMEQILDALATRDRIDEWQLAQDLDVSLGALGEALTQLEDQGAVRLLPDGDGQRMVVKL